MDAIARFLQQSRGGGGSGGEGKEVVAVHPFQVRDYIHFLLCLVSWLWLGYGRVSVGFCLGVKC